MGRRIPFDIATRLAAEQHEKDNSIYALQNKYGYKINVHHPQIRPLYERYKEKISERILSDRQRFAFEMIIFKMIERNRNEQSNIDGEADSRP